MEEPHQNLTTNIKGLAISSIFRKKWHLPGENLMGKILPRLSLTERIVFFALVGIFAFSGIFILAKANKSLMVTVPLKGGAISEGVIGFPRAVNPLLAFDFSDADKDLSLLIYSGLLKATPQGELINDLAESYSVSEDQLTYTFILKDDIYFHDGEPVTTKDIEFTVLKAQDLLVKSSKRINWEGVRMEIVNDKEIRFILSQPYFNFLENTTLGILPKHIWKDFGAEQFASSQFNLEPIGSGPYKIQDIDRDSKGIPVYYQLRSFKKYALGEPNIKNIVIRFFVNEEDLISAFKKKKVESINSIAPKDAVALQSEKVEIKNATLSRIFGLFFNQNQASIFTHKEIREALEISLDKDGLIEEIFSGYGESLYSPIPKKYSKILKGESEKNDTFAQAQEILEKNGWILDEADKIRKKKTKTEELSLKFSISTGDTEELKNVAQFMKNSWEKLGAEVDVKIFDLSDLKQNVIRPRRYDSLLFGTIIGRDLNFFPFWHSSQRNDPGLNVSLYTSVKTDKILEELRSLNNKDEREEKYADFENTIVEDIPAIFVYSPEFIYLTPSKIKNISLDFITMPSERFLNVHEWFIETSNVWKIFVD